MATATGRIERKILLEAPRSRVGLALTDPKEFGDWFGVSLQGNSMVTASGCRVGIHTRSRSGTLLSVIESCFDSVPLNRRLEALRKNSDGWDQQMKIVEKHVAAT